MAKLLVGMLLLSAAHLFSDPVSYSSTCSSYGVPVVTGASDCMDNPTRSTYPRYSSNYTYASTEVDVSLGLVNNVIVTQSLVANIDALTAPSPTNYGYGTSSQSEANYSATLTAVGTGGGFVHVVIPTPDQNLMLGSSPGSSGFSQVSITGAALIPGYPSIIGGCEVYPDVIQSQTCENSSSYFAHFPYIPIKLGVPFILSVAAGATAFGDPIIEEANGVVDNYLDFQFQILGSDLKTPVLVEAIPEPSIPGLLGVGLTAAAGLLIRRHL